MQLNCFETRKNVFQVCVMNKDQEIVTNKKVKRPQFMSLFISKEVYNEVKDNSPNISNIDSWYGSDLKFPFVSTDGSVSEITITENDLNNSNKTSRIDFKND